MARTSTPADEHSHAPYGFSPKRYNDMTPEERAERLREREATPRGLRTRLDGEPYVSPWPFKDPSEIEVDLSEWRQQVRDAKRVKLDDIQKQTFLYWFARTNRKAHSAHAAGVCWQTVANHLKADPEFEEQYKQAQYHYQDRLEMVAQEVGQEGILEPIVGGKFKNEIVAHKRVIAPNILAMQLRRSNPEYREKQEIDLNHRGGVLVAPAKMDMDEWIKMFGSAEAKKSEDGDGGAA
jgi:hypothetical protein